MRAFFLTFLCSAAGFAADPTPAIRLDQVGYLPDAPKVAMVVVNPPARAFSVRRLADDKPLFAAALGEPVRDANSGDLVQLADFSALIDPGRYYIDVPGVGRSYPFDIRANAYERPYYLAMSSFYGQRCGTAVDMGPEFPHRHPVCHLTGAWHPSSGREGPRPSAFGWHDAGDYGRYIVNSGITTGTLLWTWELFHNRIERIPLNIPESGNGTPDLLSEVRWNLEWMLSMQDTDGGVWQKQTAEKFIGFLMPERDTATSYVVGTGSAPYKSSCATGDFAAVMAIAQRVYQPYDQAFASRAGAAAAKAWTWLDAHPNVTFLRNPPGVLTGVYDDPNCADERLWAAAELWRSTGGEAYRKYFLAHYAPFAAFLKTPNWLTVGPLALWTYALAGRPDADPTALERIRRASARFANHLVELTASNPYRIALRTADYTWGSNGQAANFSLSLIVANILAPNPRYTQAALENLHYLLGRNAFSVSWVTAVGSRWVMNLHHRPSQADGIVEPWPGLLSGGPNKDREDALLRRLPADLPPMRLWIDDGASYASNENCINWNAALVFVLAATLPEPPRP
jgi:endoglucanase